MNQGASEQDQTKRNTSIKNWMQKGYYGSRSQKKRGDEEHTSREEKEKKLARKRERKA